MTLALSPRSMAESPSWPSGRRGALVLFTLAALAGASVLGLSSGPSAVEPDLARLLRFMAVLKGVFAVIAFAGAFWRLGRPATAWREIVYVAGPGLVAAGAVSLGFLASAGLATLVLHAGLFALLAAALTDATSSRHGVAAEDVTTRSNLVGSRRLKGRRIPAPPPRHRPGTTCAGCRVPCSSLSCSALRAEAS